MDADAIEEPERKLAAILAADVVGFSRMVHADETGTLHRLRRAREAVFDPAVLAHRGRVFKVMGDGILTEFPSVVLALRAALAIQEGMRRHAEGEAEEGRIVLRVGVHQGDVVVYGTDLLGDGVNVAARLERIAPPGGIAISARVQEDAAGKIKLRTEDGGERLLRNMIVPIHVFFIDPARPDLAMRQGGSGEGEADEATVVVAPQGMHRFAVVQTVANGPPEGQVLTLARLPITLGRQAPSTLVFPSSEVSRAHCRIEEQDGAAVVTDLRSTNGTFVDGAMIAGPTRLAHGAIIRVGPFALRYARADGPEAEARDADALMARGMI